MEEEEEDVVDVDSSCLSCESVAFSEADDPVPPCVNAAPPPAPPPFGPSDSLRGPSLRLLVLLEEEEDAEASDGAGEDGVEETCEGEGMRGGGGRRRGGERRRTPS